MTIMHPSLTECLPTITIVIQNFASNFNLPYTWTSPHSLLHFPLYLLITLICLIGFDQTGIFVVLLVVKYFEKGYTLGCCSTPRTKQDQAVTVGEISRFAPPEPNMCLLPQQVLAVAIGNCPYIKVQTKHVQAHKITSWTYFL